MPGIAGIITPHPVPANRSALDKMVGAMSHEDFYSQGSYLSGPAGVSVGWAVHSGSFSDALPVMNATKDIILIFYGEDHSHRSRAHALKGEHGKTHDYEDVRTLIDLYQDDERAFLRGLNGWFCGVLIDLRKKKAFLFNDRYGMQRLYYHEGKDAFYFASEAKSILKVKPKLRSIPPERLAELFSCRCILENRSLFQDIYTMPGGSCWEFQYGRTTGKGKYFEPEEYEEQALLPEETLFTKLQDRMQEILPRYLGSGEPVAFSLTGGMDTRTILANVPYPLSNLQSYTHSGSYRDCYDARISSHLAKSCGLDHHTLKLDDSFIRDFPKLAEKTVYIADGYMDLNGTPSLYLHGKARTLSTVRLTGNYGDQVLVLRRNLRPSSGKTALLNGDMSEYMANAQRSLQEISSGHPLSFFLFKQAPWFDYPRYSLEQSQMVQRSPFMDNDLVNLLYQFPVDFLTSQDVRQRLVREGNSDLAGVPTERGYLGPENSLFSQWRIAYRKYLFQAEYYFNYGMPQWLAKLNNFFEFLKLENLVLEQNKYYNFRRLFRHELAGYVKDVLLDERTLSRPFLNRNMVEKMVLAHTGGSGNYTAQINRLLSTELTFRTIIEDRK